MHEEVPALVEQLRKFPELMLLGVSNNPGLGSGGAGIIVSSLAGARHLKAAVRMLDSLHTADSNPRMRQVHRRQRLRSRERMGFAPYYHCINTHASRAPRV
jgi:hypothetical protein